MTDAPVPRDRVVALRFGAFELRLDSLELFRGEERLALQQQPARLLALLASRPGVTVPREEIREAIWGDGTFVDSEQGINYCVRQIRIALGDRADRPEMIETVPRRGYRFVAPVETVDVGHGPATVSEAPASRPVAEPRPRRSSRKALVMAALALVVLVGVAGFVVFFGSDQDSGSDDRDEGGAIRTVVVPEEAHARYLEARHLLDRADVADPVADARRAIELLRAALEEAPEYAPAHAALGDAWLYRYDVHRSEALEHAESAARRALELDPGLARAHALLAAPLLFLDFDWDGASEHVRRALELDPDHVEALFLKAVLLSARGRHDEGIAAARRAIELDPGHLPNVSLGWFYFFARRYDRAIEEAERVLELDPTDEPSHRVLLLSALESGDEARADRELWRYWGERTFASFQEIGGDLPPDEELRERIEQEMRAEKRDHPEQYPGALTLLETWWETFDEERDLGTRGVNPTLPAQYAVYSGDHAAAVHYLLWGCEERAGSWDLVFVAEDPRWDPVRDRPEFDRVLECVGLAGPRRPVPRLRRLLD